MRAALLQTNSGIDISANAASFVDAVARASSEGADMLFSPEMVGYLDKDRARAANQLCDEAGDAFLAAARNAAAKYGIWLHIGSLGLKGERDDSRWSNRSFVIDDGGNIRARYDKIHLFDVDLPSGESWRESSVYGPGGGGVIARTPWADIGLSVCYDLRFPYLYQALSSAGARILTVPAAFTVPTGVAHWEVLLRARAIENACFIIAPAQTGKHQDGRETYGHSLVIDPWGKVLLDMGKEAGIGYIDLDLVQVDDVRARIPVLNHRQQLKKDVTIR